MRITVLALGSMGDVTPCAALGGGLVAAGHRVRLASHANFASLAARFGLDFTPAAGDVRELLQQSGASLPAILGRYFGLAHELARGFSSPELGEADLILNQLPGGLYGWDIAEQRGVPMFALSYLPQAATRAFPMIAYPRAFSWLPGYNRFTYRAAAGMVWLAFRGAINRWRRETLGLPPQPPGGRFHELGSARVPYLMGLSPHLLPPPADWGEYVHVTGYWYPTHPGWQPARSLLDFLSAGAPPIFIGFGSMPVKDPAHATRTILQALEQSGQRAVLHAGWADLGAEALPEQVFRLEYAPYDWLFPRMSALVIHGGAGSAHFAALSGAPTLVTPFLFDQFMWGRRFAELGAGPPPLPFKRLTAARLARAIDQASGDAQMRARARALGEEVRKEPGISWAIEIIEKRKN